ncbi:hypothetical protein PEX1_058380 [Penicillium expansum]|uniref:Cysteine-rich transmembrane CYSTM domain-containing protein n=1 Tax=Penicillium expansum TaxID=27334 RepID=A0A0A2ISD1_PENEN|nr:hypothetical protein PEX2_041590 [Penicillium expansum]KGO45373.1 hypothetical protein PEXP_059870 [Penicillium expansum]KGO63145.1 hypothetical protein PEX2_041590 [Penicillium expansum]KGO72616.1 hypothetical protein PEX1_058380 [Penicillium expansum]
MFSNGLISWFSSKESTPNPTSIATSIENHQPISPKAPTTDRMVTEQPNSQENMMKLRGGGAGDVCCGLCAGLLCFECCENCC